MTEDIVDTPLPAEPRTEAGRRLARHILSATGNHAEEDILAIEREAAAPEPRPDLREALDLIAAEGCQAYRHYDSPNGDDPSWDFCLHPDNRDLPLSGDVNEDRCWPCLAHAALATTPPAVEDRYWNGHLADCRRRGGTNRSAKQHACSCGFLSHLLTASDGDGRPMSWERDPATPPAQPLPTVEPSLDVDQLAAALRFHFEDHTAGDPGDHSQCVTDIAARYARLSEARDE